MKKRRQFLGNTLGRRRNKPNNVYSYHVSFTSEFFTNNRRRLQESAPDSVIVIAANGQLQRSGDTAFPFRQDSNFWYLTGLKEPDLLLVITPDREFVILPKQNSMRDMFDGSFDEPAAKEQSGIKNIFSHHEGWEELHRLAKKHDKFYTCMHKGHDEPHALYLNPAKPRLVSRLKKLDDNLHVEDIRKNLALLRMKKQPEEIAAIEEAIEVTSKAVTKVMRGDWQKRYKYDADIKREVTYEFMKQGKPHSFEMIAAGGKNACTIHHSGEPAKIAKDEIFLVDVGAESNMYAADITRVFMPKAPTKQQKQVYQAVKSAQADIIKLVKPGVKMRKIEDQTKRLIGKQLVKLGLTNRATRKIIRKYYPHAFGHHLGLDVHDVADFNMPLEEGNVITVEPGIYIPEWGIGVRLEDDILVTKKGRKNLSASLPS